MPECRLCLKNRSKSKLISIFDLDRDKRKTSEKIRECTSIEISECDELPKVVCNYCLKNLTVAYRFRQECRRNDSKLRKRLGILNNQDHTKTTRDHHVKNNTDNNCIYSKNLENGGDGCRDVPVGLVAAVASSQGLVIRKNYVDDAISDLQALENSDELSRSTNTKQNYLEGRTPTVYNTNESSSDADTGVIKMEANEDVSSEAESASKVVVPGQDRLRDKRAGVVEESTRKKFQHSAKSQASFVCKVCGKVFKSKMGLQGHERRHTGERPYMCQACGKSFHVVNELRKHSLVHSGLKPYQCRHCSRRFSDWGSRFKHERLHSGERPYKCDECGKCFNYSCVLANHKLTHSGVKNFLCNICQKKFTLKFHLTNHNRKYHTV